MNHKVRILESTSLTHDVTRFRLEKPVDYKFSAGQATELMLEDRPGQAAPFTFTSLDSDPYLELMIKIYSSHNGMTHAIAKKKAGDYFLISDAWDSYINHGPGVFVAGGAGITPFIALLRRFQADKSVGKSQLFFSNKTSADVFLEDELRGILGPSYINVITRDGSNREKYIDLTFLKAHIVDVTGPFYVCGPPAFVEAMQQHLAALGVSEELVGISL